MASVSLGPVRSPSGQRPFGPAPAGSSHTPTVFEGLWDPFSST